MAVDPTFSMCFQALTGHAPMPWQQRLYDRFISAPPGENIPARACIPTGLGKTSVIAIWLIALAHHSDKMPRRMVYVVNRRTVVDQTTTEVEKLRLKLLDPRKHAAKREYAENLEFLKESIARLCGMDTTVSLAISTLRGQFADNQEWSADPSRPAVICGTVDMIGSRLLFEGYRIGFRSRALHAGFLGQDALLVHDEAHLEPAFQKLIEAIQREQNGERERSSDVPWPGLRIMALSATARANVEETNRENRHSFGLTDQEWQSPDDIPDPPTEPIHHVWRRLKASKSLRLHEVADEKKLADEIAKLALEHKAGDDTVLVFVRTVDNVSKVIEKLRAETTGVQADCVQQLTGTMRGLERDQLVSDPVFIRFRPESDRPNDVAPAKGAVYLVCTSAGEVGVNLSADHMVCDLSTYDSTAQRLGRVNRFGDRNDTRVDVVHPREFSEKKPDPQREATLALLKRLPQIETGVHDASPKALGELPAAECLESFAPEPAILPATDILFDAWALTTIRGAMPGRPPVAPYLHGVAEWDPPRTSVAWREEVELITPDMIDREGEDFPAELLADYPLKPHELLSDRTDRVYGSLTTLVAEPKASVKGEKRQVALERSRTNAKANVWLIDDRGSIAVITLENLLDDDKKRVLDRLANSIVLLPPSVGGLSSSGLLDGALKKSNDVDYDVADRWLDEDGKPRRTRHRSNEKAPTDGPEGVTWIRTVDTNPGADESQPQDEESDVDAEAEATAAGNETPHDRFWHWFVRPHDAGDAARASKAPVALDDHTRDVVERATRIVKDLNLPNDLKRAVLLAAELHDTGKKREMWQRSIGNPEPADWHAKSGKPGTAFRDGEGGRKWLPGFRHPYRHEFGSLLDALDRRQEYRAKFEVMTEEMRDVALHLVAAHHGYARPHFPVEATTDPDHAQSDCDDAAVEAMRRYARLQRRYGRWGLAYLESLLRAADWAASAKPGGEGRESGVTVAQEAAS